MRSEQQRLQHVCLVVRNGVENGIWNADERGTKYCNIDVGMFTEDLINYITVSNVALLETSTNNEFTSPSNEIIDNNRFNVSIQAGGCDGASNEARPSRYENFQVRGTPYDENYAHFIGEASGFEVLKLAHGFR